MKPKSIDELIEMIESCIGSGELLNISDEDLVQIRKILMSHSNEYQGKTPNQKL